MGYKRCSCADWQRDLFVRGFCEPHPAVRCMDCGANQAEVYRAEKKAIVERLSSDQV